VADNVLISDANLNAVAIASDDCGAAGQVEFVKIAYSANGVATPVLADTNGVEVQGAGVAGTPAGGVASVQGVSGGTPVPVSGTVAISGTSAVSNAGTFAVQAATRATGQTQINVKVAYSASQTAATVYTPTSGKKFVCDHIVISASATGSVYLFDGTDASASAWSPTLTLAANGGWEAHFSDEAPLVSSAANNVIKYTSGAGAAGSIWLHGWEE
jgi:hypothetical protein